MHKMWKYNKIERECNKLTRICNNNILMQFYFVLNTIRFRKWHQALCDDSTIYRDVKPSSALSFTCTLLLKLTHFNKLRSSLLGKLDIEINLRLVAIMSFFLGWSLFYAKTTNKPKQNLFFFPLKIYYKLLQKLLLQNVYYSTKLLL